MSPAAVSVTLGEGSTPLVPSVRAGARLGLPALHFKLEIVNPTGSYKDRFTAAAVGRMLERAERQCVATSSGNTGSSLAAFCARYSVRCVIVANQHAPAGKLLQMRAHGAEVLRVRDFVTSPEITARTYEILHEFSRAARAPLIVSAYRYCPEGMQAVEAIGRELRCVSGIRHVFVPCGGGGLYTAVAKGLDGSGIRAHLVQPRGCSTAAAAWLRGDQEIRSVQSTTRISGLAVPFDIDAGLALHWLRANGGSAFEVDDEEVWAAQRDLLREEGIYAEPAGAAALAAVPHALRQGVLADRGATVCLVTGHGFKDLDSIAAAAEANPGKVLDIHELAGALS